MKKLIKFACIAWLVFAIYHVAGFYSGRLPLERGNIAAMIIGGLSGGIGSRLVGKRMNFRNVDNLGNAV